MSQNRQIRKWRTIEHVKSDDYKIFSVDTVRRTSPRNNLEQDFFKIQSADWLNIIAVTSDQQVVLIEQYRHGADEVQLEIPGGIIDSGESRESAALRELVEETGYIGKKAIEIGYVNPNPALFSNKCFTYVVPNVISGTQNLEETEDIATRLVSIKDISSLIVNGHITHGLVVAAFYFFENFQNTK